MSSTNYAAGQVLSPVASNTGPTSIINTSTTVANVTPNNKCTLSHNQGTQVNSKSNQVDQLQATQQNRGLMGDTFESEVERIVETSLNEHFIKLSNVMKTGENSNVLTDNNNKTTMEAKEERINLLVESFIRYKTRDDCPLSGFAAKEIFQSHVRCLEIKEVETGEEEPTYMIFGNGKDLKTSTSSLDKDGDDKVNCKCDDCNYQDECDEYTYGPYCVSAVKRYFNENKYNVSLRAAYQVYVAHYNRALDFHSYNPFSSSENIRDTQVTKPTYCMKEGSLKYSLFWIQWHIENGPEKEYYNQMRSKKKRIKMNKLAKKAATFRYKYDAT